MKDVNVYTTGIILCTTANTLQITARKAASPSLVGYSLKEEWGVWGGGKRLWWSRVWRRVGSKVWRDNWWQWQPWWLVQSQSLALHWGKKKQAESGPIADLIHYPPTEWGSSSHPESRGCSSSTASHNHLLCTGCLEVLQVASIHYIC